jgi:hypothetical protein
MDVGQVSVRQQTAALIGDFLVERRAVYRRGEHELVEVSLVTDRRLDFLDDAGPTQSSPGLQGCWNVSNSDHYRFSIRAMLMW